MNLGNKIVRTAFFIVNKVLFIFFILFLIIVYKVRLPIPDVDLSIVPENYKREVVAENHYRVGKNWLKKNKYGVWEMYLEGKPYERGVIYGVLAKELIEIQEEHFVKQLDEFVPSHFFQQFLKITIAWFNRDMDEFIPEENKQEIYGVSRSFSDKFDYVGPKFYRILYYHAAHDIGHALADYRMVGCTSFAVKNEFSSDKELLIGRNFDFYMGDNFAKEKLMLFMKPDQGYGFGTYAWGGLTGVLSGMNEHGLTVTLNASKSDVPTGAKDPISLLAREILQYAKTIEDAVAIAQKRSTFVSESLLIGSALDNDAVLIEKSPTKMDVYRSTTDQLVCSNHYQSERFLNDSENLENIEFTDSKFRFDRMSELLQIHRPLNYLKAVNVLRNQKGLNGKDIGLGNPKALNQLIAHHAVVFKPQRHQVWISTMPYQLGEFICYDLDDVFHHTQSFASVDALMVKKDVFADSKAFSEFEYFRKLKVKIVRFAMFGQPLELSEKQIERFIKANPNSFEVYYNLGRYYEAKNNPCKAVTMYEIALTKEIASKREHLSIQETFDQLNQICN